MGDNYRIIRCTDNRHGHSQQRKLKHPMSSRQTVVGNNQFMIDEPQTDNFRNQHNQNSNHRIQGNTHTENLTQTFLIA